MIEINRKVSLLPAQPVPVSLKPLQDGSLPARAAAPAAEAPSYTRHFSSNALHSRLPGVLGSGDWSVGWSADLPSDPMAIVRHGQHIVCQWPGVWRLFGAGGKLIREDYSGQSPVVIDPRARMFQLITATLSWEARMLDSGELAFCNALPYNENYSWPVLFRAGNRMIAFASVRPPFRHGGQDPGSSLIQMIELGMPMQVDAAKLVRNLTRFEALTISSQDARAAAEDDAVVMAAPGVLVRFDSDLAVAGAFTGTFVPQQLSLDESGWMHLFVESGGKQALWMITPEGSRVAMWTAPPEFSDAIQPPIIGYDRRVYLLGRAEMVALDHQLKQLWIKPVPGGSVGAGVTIDGRVLVTSSNTVLAFDPQGNDTVLRKFTERLTTPPVYTSDHEILVGAQKKLYCLVRR